LGPGAADEIETLGGVGRRLDRARFIKFSMKSRRQRDKRREPYFP
jgi:hypothetical protein